MISSIPDEILQSIKECLQGEVSGFPFEHTRPASSGQTGIPKGEIKGFSFASGGCINKGGQLKTTGGNFFLKWNTLQRFPGMFASEAKGLSLLRGLNVIDVPEVIYSGSAGAYQFLLLQFIPQSSRSELYWQNLGSGLAALHQNTASHFGLDHDNYIGSLTQHNNQSLSWIDFFIEKRLEIQLRMAVDSKRIDTSLSKKFNTLFPKLPSLLPTERAAMLHGDLWSGNVIANSTGEPCLLDPAVYFGHREVDLAMTQLFGGFDESFMESYDHTFPLIPGYKERFDIYNLYPLLVHLNLFGAGYKSQVVSIVNRFV